MSQKYLLSVLVLEVLAVLHVRLFHVLLDLAGVVERWDLETILV
jgi:hypothetical protein